MDETHENPNDPAAPVESTGPVRASGPAAPFEPHFDDDATQAERKYAMWIHLATLIAWVLAVVSDGFGFPVPILVAGIMWAARKKDSPFIDDHGREALNFQISLIVMFILAVIVGLMLCLVGVVVTTLAVTVLAVAGSIMGAVAASRGQYFRYPATFRFLKG